MTLTYDFEELPLIIENGFHAGLVSGSAEISFYNDGEWHVRTIYLGGYKKLPSGQYERRKIEIDNSYASIRLAIWSELTNGNFKDSVSDAVQEALAEEGIVQRTEYQEHSTLNRAMQGV